MARPRLIRVVPLGVQLVRCPCGLYQPAPMWLQKGHTWLSCLLCGPTIWKVGAEHDATSRPTCRRHAA